MMRAVSAAETAPTTYPWAVHAEQLRVRAGRHLAVDGLDLALGTGVHGLLGPNGAGKTTLMRALATVVKPAGGRLTLLGEAVGGRADLRRGGRAGGGPPCGGCEGGSATCRSSSASTRGSRSASSSSTWPGSRRCRRPR